MKRIVLIIFFVGIMNAYAADENRKYEVDVEKKVNDCRVLVAEAVKFFKKNSVEDSCKAFVQDKHWRKGEIGIFVFNSDGVCYAFSHDKSVIWQSFYNKKTLSENEFIPAMMKAGKQGGLVNYKWDNSTMESYVRTVVKNGKTYIIGAGFFPASAAYSAEQMVKAAVRYGEINSAKALFEQINNPAGMFVEGEIFLQVFDLEGNVFAHGTSPELVGQNLIDDMTPNGKYLMRDMIEIAKSSEGEGWYSFLDKRGSFEQRSYVARFTDQKTGKEYVVTGGYYPTIDDNTVVSLVKRAAGFLRNNESKAAFAEFSKKMGDFATGSVTLFVYDTKGVSVADMANPAFVGLNLMNTRDAEGKYVTKSIIEHAERYPHGGWLGFSFKNAYAMMYIEKVSTPDGDFIIGASYFPTSKYIHVRFMVDRAVFHLKGHSKEASFDLFSSRDPDFLRGDVSVFVYNKDGIIFVDGKNRNNIWKDDRELRDDKGRLISDKIIAIATSGGGWFEFNQNNALCRVYVNQVEKETASKEQVETFIVGSGYYM